ncbi:MAG: hypothetical protein V3T23_03090, partial [Nitrososphaerales archaeon]
RVLGRAQKHCWLLTASGGLANPETMPEVAAAAYAESFPDDERGTKRAFNVGKIFANYKADIERRANELDDFNG